jgi:hypothetical protein
MHVRWRIWVPVFAALVGVAWVVLSVAAFHRGLVGPPREFTLADRPLFLTEQLALVKARATLALDGLDPADWQAYPDDRTAAPDGRRDEYLSRDGLSPNLGSVMFRGPRGQIRFVSVELAGDRVICQSSRGK